MLEFGKLFSDINHYSWLDRLIRSSKWIYENYPDLKEYAKAYIILSLKMSDIILSLTTSSEGYLNNL